MSEPTERTNRTPPRAPWWMPVAIVLLTLLAYAPTLNNPFVFDDVRSIVQNERVHDLSNLGSILASSRRPVVDITLAFNCTIAGCGEGSGEPGVVGFHVVNVLIHAGAALLLFGIIRRTVGLAAKTERARAASAPLAFFVAALWALHPLQTESVTYIIQRAESLMGLFYLLTIYSLLRGATSDRRAPLWYAVCIGACALGMGSKAVMITAPVAAMLFDHTFLARSIRELLRRRWWVHLGLFGSIAILFAVDVAPKVLGMGPTPGTATVGFHVEELAWHEYLRTQPEVILHYLRLAFFPVGQVIDYSWPVQDSPVVIVTAGTIVGLLLLLALIGLWWRRWWGFALGWFFLVLAPTSSFVPIKDLAFEHRMYLPLAGIVALVVVGLHKAWPRIEPRLSAPSGLLPGAGAVALLLLGGATIARNEVYSSEVALWRDVVEKRPGNVRAMINLASLLGRRGEYEEAIRVARRALDAEPGNRQAVLNLANALRLSGRKRESIRHYEELVDAEPDNPRYQYAMGRALADVGDYDRALSWYERVARIDDERRLQRNLPLRELVFLSRIEAAKLNVNLRRFEDAIPHYRNALELRPDDASAAIDLANCHMALGRLEPAERILRNVVRADPRNVLAIHNLGFNYYQQGRVEEAASMFQRALELDPDNAQVLRSMRMLRTELQRRGGGGE